MLEEFVVFSSGGLVLWSLEITPAVGSPTNDLIRNVLLEVNSSPHPALYSWLAKRLRWDVLDRKLRNQVASV